MTKSQFAFEYTYDSAQLWSYRLNKLLGDVVISQGGVVPFINPELLPSKSKCVVLFIFLFLFLFTIL